MTSVALARSVTKRLPSGCLVARNDRDGFTLGGGKPRMRLGIDSLPPEAIAIRMDNIGHMAGITDGRWKRVCDYLLIADESAISYAVFIELKRTLHGNNEPKEQLLRSLPIFEYLYSMCMVARRISPCEPQVSAHTKLSLHFWIAGKKSNPRGDRQTAHGRPPKLESSTSYCGATIYMLTEPVVKFSRLVEHPPQTKIRRS